MVSTKDIFPRFDSANTSANCVQPPRPGQVLVEIPRPDLDVDLPEDPSQLVQFMQKMSWKLRAVMEDERAIPRKSGPPVVQVGDKLRVITGLNSRSDLSEVYVDPRKPDYAREALGHLNAHVGPLHAMYARRVEIPRYFPKRVEVAPASWNRQRYDCLPEGLVDNLRMELLKSNNQLNVSPDRLSFKVDVAVGVELLLHQIVGEELERAGLTAFTEREGFRTYQLRNRNSSTLMHQLFHLGVKQARQFIQNRGPKIFTSNIDELVAKARLNEFSACVSAIPAEDFHRLYVEISLPDQVRLGYRSREDNQIHFVIDEA